ncbi:hypothetical protein NOF04DRAFT_11054 [Fusarium oxysporum II5]|uniref:Uncharacterized protein n=1 Tax=Fusarium odoratissimum (strain NRRL 54006) TaxID=1089451 RepID=X0J183_FUSO5|nr:uncharacterized protein FOIG_12340 [Fusarium odoratissimum NRRL 54006]EXL94892.1 hypothetical protein FOIG_12340 [Fusarium odoratissimum NRRL 54006]KAK2135777.1 hypothetical protein NOF04DRAFT_11054 [Fusarium oxysporum II5]
MVELLIFQDVIQVAANKVEIWSCISLYRDMVEPEALHPEGSSNAGDMRYAACIMLDTEILAQLMPVPKDLSCNTTEHFRSPYWVNMVEAKPNINTNTKEAFRVALFGEFDLLHYWFD